MSLDTTPEIQEVATTTLTSKMDFTTLGMFVIDEIHPPPPHPPSTDICGGAGTFAALGARLFRPPPSSRGVGWVVHKGHDFPENVERELQGWESGLKWVQTPERRTTRAWNGYKEGGEEERAFKFTTEKIRVDETQLDESMLLSRCFHMVCMPSRCIKLVEGITAERKRVCTQKGVHIAEPQFVWEPTPDSCTPDGLDAILKATQYVDIISPNHTELAAMFTDAKLEQVECDGDKLMNNRCETLLAKGFKEKAGAVVVRCGSRGCYIRSWKERRMCPAFHQPSTGVKSVVDPTGAGNTFLGGFCVGLVEECMDGLTHLENGAVYGTVAASFAVEQTGLPKLTPQVDMGRELWNDDSVQERLNKLIDRLGP